MNRKFTPEAEKFIKENWFTMGNDEIALKTNISIGYVTEKARKLGLPDKREFLKASHKKVEGYKKPEEYKDSTQAEEEIKGRVKTAQLRGMKDTLKLNDKLKIKTFVDNNMRAIVLTGRIVQKTEELIVVQTKHYKECFKYKDFYTRMAVII